MRQGSHSKRLRGRGGRKNTNPRSQNFESNGPEVKVRGNAQQVVEKYLTLARDASLAGDRVASESYFQHAEHYFRVMTANGMHENREPQQINTPAEFDAPQPEVEPNGAEASNGAANGAGETATDDADDADDATSAGAPESDSGEAAQV